MTGYAGLLYHNWDTRSFTLALVGVILLSYLTITAGTTNCPILGGIEFQSAPP